MKSRAPCNTTKQMTTLLNEINFFKAEKNLYQSASQTCKYQSKKDHSEYFVGAGSKSQIKNFRPGAANHRLTMLSNLLSKQIHKQGDASKNLISPAIVPIHIRKVQYDTKEETGKNFNNLTSPSNPTKANSDLSEFDMDQNLEPISYEKVKPEGSGVSG